MTLTNRLRDRFYAALGDRTLDAAAREIGISRVALWQFLRGDDSKAATLNAIDRWITNVQRGERKPHG